MLTGSAIAMLDFGLLSLPLIIALAGVFGLYMAWTIGANDVANAMGTSVGSGALSLKNAIIVAGVLEFAGAVLAGGNVTDTVRKGILNADEAFVAQNTTMAGNATGHAGNATVGNATMPSGGGLDLVFSNELYVYGMLAALLGTAIWLTIATWWGMPVSTTHSIVGGVIGAGMFAAGSFYGWDQAGSAVNWDKVIEIFQSWVFAPLLGGLFAFAIFWFIKLVIFNSKDPIASVQRWRWVFILLDVGIITMATLLKGLKNVQAYKDMGWITKNAAGNTVFTDQGIIAAILITGGITLAAELVIRWRQRKAPHPVAQADHDAATYKQVERRFIALQVVTAASVAFAHGANDVANAIGPLAGIVAVANAEPGVFPEKAVLPMWILLVGGIGIVLGLATWGWRVMQTIGKKLSEITPSRGFAAELAAATTIILATTQGIPVSTSQILVGSVLGVGLARGVAAIDLKVLRDIVASWFLTLPVAAVLSGIIFLTFKNVLAA